MRVFCPEHKRGFFAPRQNPVKCENRGHELPRLNFAGDDLSQVELQWQYCCNCEHFCPISSQGESLERCPVCTRRSSLLYVCDRCFTASFESNTPVETKNFTISADGLPQPSCPGCLLGTSGAVREHYCDGLEASFSTALNSCPICGERLDVGPTFPSLVEPFLRKSKSAHKVAATFDYDSGLFVAVEDGEFVIVTSEAEPSQSFALPRLTHFSKVREFYEIYQDYYHHRSELRPGLVFVHEPALVEPKREGWQFISSGMLEVVDDQPKSRARKIRPSELEAAAQPSESPQVMTTPEQVEPGEIETFAPEEAPAQVTAPEEVRGHVCKGCGSIIEDRYSFCWHCGEAMKPNHRGNKSDSLRPPRNADGRKGLRAN
jgi:hypothetical protein